MTCFFTNILFSSRASWGVPSMMWTSLGLQVDTQDSSHWYTCLGTWSRSPLVTRWERLSLMVLIQYWLCTLVTAPQHSLPSHDQSCLTTFSFVVNCIWNEIMALRHKLEPTVKVMQLRLQCFNVQEHGIIHWPPFIVDNDAIENNKILSVNSTLQMFRPLPAPPNYEPVSLWNTIN